MIKGETAGSDHRKEGRRKQTFSEIFSANPNDVQNYFVESALPVGLVCEPLPLPLSLPCVIVPALAVSTPLVSGPVGCRVDGFSPESTDMESVSCLSVEVELSQEANANKMAEIISIRFMIF